MSLEGVPSDPSGERWQQAQANLDRLFPESVDDGPKPKMFVEKIVTTDPSLIVPEKDRIDPQTLARLNGYRYNGY
jgi:hypothetical protein